jgi:hypothetical protein
VPDLTFFRDPTVDRVLGVVMELAAEVYVLRDRLHTVERLLQDSGTLDLTQLEGYEPTDAERAQRLAERDALISRILAPMHTEYESPAPPYESA